MQGGIHLQEEDGRVWFVNFLSYFLKILTELKEFQV